MQLTKLLQTDEERAVSPVIGVILMVAITVILAAVIASFVLGLGGEQDVAPTATFDFNYDADDGDLTITHTGGDNIKTDELFVRGSGIENGQWAPETGGSGELGGDASANIDGESAVSSGDSVTIDDGSGGDIDSGYVARVVWEANSGSSSSELATDRGPDA